MCRNQPIPNRAKSIRHLGARALPLALVPLALVPPAGAREPIGPENPGELEAFLDGLMPSLLASQHVPGAVFVMVKDGEVFLAKGFGFANAAERRPVDPATTLFRVASLSKLVTATAALQLAERGQLDLHADVNRYLGDFHNSRKVGENTDAGFLFDDRSRL